MTYRVATHKWILYKHTNNFELVTAVAGNLKYVTKSSISPAKKLELLKKLKELDFYKERNPELPLDSINHRINTLAYFMFGYKDKIGGEDRFLYSPLGNLFLKHIDDRAKRRLIFLTMLWAVQFPHPHGGTADHFKLYPFRLIFKLLMDPRLGHKLYAYEVAYHVVLMESVTNESYEELVAKLLEMRSLTNGEIEAKFKQDEHLYVNATYEWDYYISKLFEGAGVFTRAKGEVICKLHHGTSTERKLTRNFVQLPADLRDFCQRLEQAYPFTAEPLSLDDPERLHIDVVKEIYGFYPQLLLKEIGEYQDELQAQLLELPKLIERYADNNEGAEATLFEHILEDAFNMFVNVRAKWVGGPDNTDVECLYTDGSKKFVVDAKSTKNKLSGLSAGRLRRHREKLGGQYTIVVTPRYVPAVLTDISSAPIVIIRASTFAEYLSNHIDNGIRDIDYADFDRIITKNLGKDISADISQLTLERFSVRES